MLRAAFICSLCSSKIRLDNFQPHVCFCLAILNVSYEALTHAIRPIGQDKNPHMLFSTILSLINHIPRLSLMYLCCIYPRLTSTYHNILNYPTLHLLSCLNFLHHNQLNTSFTCLLVGKLTFLLSSTKI